MVLIYGRRQSIRRWSVIKDFLNILKFIAWIGLFPFLSFLHAGNLSDLLSSEDLFSIGSEAFQERYFAENGFRWDSASKDRARSFGHAATLEDIEIVEILAKFKENKLNTLFLSLYNKGDEADVYTSQRVFDEKIDAVTETLDDFFGVESMSIRSSGVGSKSVKYWQKGSVLYHLNYKSGKDRSRRWIAEYINLEVKEQVGTYHAGRSRSKQSFKSKRELLVNVEKRENGSVVVGNVPMVNQGPKGYCACATAARLLQYYGREVNQHEVAEMAGASSKGTSPDLLVDALRKIASKMKLTVKVEEDFDFKKFKKMLKDYNKLARKKKLSEVFLPTSGTIYISDIYGAMNPEVLVELKLKSTRKKHFLHVIEENVKKGIPLVWSVRLGIVKEPEIPQASGGHMRLITGYNLKEKTIHYSDTWGVGHEDKTMSLDHAYAITTGLYLLNPRL